MANGTYSTPNGKRDNMKASPSMPKKQDPRDEKAKKKAKKPVANLSQPAPKSKGPVPKPMPAPKGTASGMGGKVAKGSKNPIKKLVNRVRRTK